ncbi:MAG: nitrous oxide reductase accessory protein NosL [SAR324 cluster bacterium]|nr:nitrous oxide reductase accessory protein NosL [SAR324 cluster bacterium]
MLGMMAAATTVTAVNALVSKSAAANEMQVDGTPRQFFPKNGPDPNPLKNELEKYPKCPYCGMGRKKWHHSRHLIHYSDNLVDPTCSIHCAALSLSLNLDRSPKAIYAADFGSSSKVKPLIDAEKATYLIGSDLKGTMTHNSKMAFLSKEAAQAAEEEHGGEIADFDKTLTTVYLNMAQDTIMIRKRRARKKAMMKQSKG